MKNESKIYALTPLAFFILGWIFLSAQPATAWTQISLAWSSNTEPDIAGYRVFSRLEDDDYDYNIPAWEGSETICTIDIWDENSRWCFVARAFDTEGFESADSNEACTEGPGSPSGAANPLGKYAAGSTATEDETDTSGGCFIRSLS